MSDWPDSKETFLARFAEREPRWVLELIAVRCSKGSIDVGGSNGERWYSLAKQGEWGTLTNIVYDGNILDGGRYGWVTDEGEFLTCAHASHERLLLLMGLDILTIEQKWVRVSMTLVAMWGAKPNDKQIKTLMKLVDDSRIMPGAAASFGRRMEEDGW